MMSISGTRPHRKAILFSLLFSCSIQVLFFGYAGSLFASQLDGQVSLPGGATAPTAGLRVNIVMVDVADHNNQVISAVTIPAGDSSRQYAATLPDDPAASWRVSYYYWGKDYVQTAYYASAGTTWKNTDATLLAGGQNHFGVDLTLLPGKRISGHISLPSGRVSPSGGIFFYANSEDITHQSSTTHVSCIVQEGQNSSSYYLTVPDDSGLRFRISYTYYGTDYLETGYYSDSGTRKAEDQATILSGGQDFSGVDMTALTTFSWDLFLPAIINAHHS